MSEEEPIVCFLCEEEINEGQERVSLDGGWWIANLHASCYAGVGV